MWPCNYDGTRGGLRIRRMIENCTTQFAGKRRLSSRVPGRPNRGGEEKLEAWHGVWQRKLVFSF